MSSRSFMMLLIQFEKLLNVQVPCVAIEIEIYFKRAGDNQHPPSEQDWLASDDIANVSQCFVDLTWCLLCFTHCFDDLW